MQSVRSSVARPAASARPARAAVVVRASAESRRGFLSALVAGAALATVQKAQALTPVDLLDDRKAVQKGFDIIYEARDLSLPQSQRDGLTQARTSLEAAVSRAKESEKRIDTELAPLIQKKYWTLAKELLRGQVGTLRFDLNTLASAKAGKEDKKKALALRKDFIASVEALDFAIRSKDQESAVAKLGAAEAALDAVLAFVA